MKCKSTFLLLITPALMLAGYLLLVMALCCIAYGKIESVGTNAGAVQFDAVIELNRYSPRSSRHDYMVIFARYWVASDYYSATIVWAEPQSSDLFFAVNPPTLSFSSNKQGFKVYHELNNKYNETYKKPLNQRGIFRHKFGGYPIGDIRFAEYEALAQRIYADDLIGLEGANQADGDLVNLFVQATEGGNERNVTRIKIHTSGERIDSMQLFNANNRMIKDISYEYENNIDNNFLHKLTADLPEHLIMVGFKVGGIKVTLDGKEYQYRDLEATHHIGGRTCIVEYEPIKLGDKKVTLPVKVIVRNQKEGQILRCVQMMNFKQVELDAAGAEEAAGQFGAFNADQHEYEKFRLKYRKKAPTEIDKKDVEIIEQLRDRFKKALAEVDKNTGEKLKYMNSLIELDRIVGNVSEMERHYKKYLSTLNESKLVQMILVGGYGVIETLMFRQRRSEAEHLLGLWINAALKINDDESILLFARQQLAKNRLWTTIKLLDVFTSKKHCNTDYQFEAQSLRCIALGELCKLMRSDDIAKKGLIAEVQANWVVSVGKDNLGTMFADSIDQARRSFTELPKPTEYQQALKKQLDKIGQEVNKKKTSNSR